MKRWKILPAAVLFLVWRPLPTVAGPVVWSDGFESGDFSAWSAAGGNWRVVTSTLSAHTGARGADIAGSTAPEPDILLWQIGSVGYLDLDLQYWFKVRNDLEAGDEVILEWTADGLNWQTLTTYANQVAGDWQMALFDLPTAADDNPDFGFRLSAALSGATDRMNFDDFVLSGTVVPEPATAFFLLIGSLALRLVRPRRAI